MKLLTLLLLFAATTALATPSRPVSINTDEQGRFQNCAFLMLKDAEVPVTLVEEHGIVQTLLPRQYVKVCEGVRLNGKSFLGVIFDQGRTDCGYENLSGPYRGPCPSGWIPDQRLRPPF